MSNPGRKFQQWRALQPWERRALIKLFFLLPLIWFVLRMYGFNRARHMAEFELPSGSVVVEEDSMQKARRYAELTAIAARYGLHKANCLHQSLALCWLLRRQNMTAQIRIGVLPNATPFQAHAWVELDGQPLGQSVDQYKAFDRLASDPDKVKFV